MLRELIVFLAAACGLMAQTDAGLDLWMHVREHIRASSAGLPNYSCEETMERSIIGPSGQIEFLERMRLEVLFSEKKELFAWPGSSAFTSKPLESWISAGAIGNGDFATELYNLFVISSATVKYGGVETRDEHALHRFDFQAPILDSRYTLVVNGKSAITGYGGSFWVDQESLDIVRLETHATEIPADLDCGEARRSVTFGRVSLGAGERQLPSAAELTIVSRDGRESHNKIAFGNCRQYATSSSLSFTMHSDVVTEAKVPLQRALPADSVLVLRLEQPISLGQSAAGDQVVARLDKAVTAGSVQLPKGTRVLGRIRRLEQHFRTPASILVGLEFFSAEAPDGLITFSARFTGPRARPEVTRSVYSRLEIVPGADGLAIEDDGIGTGVATFRVPGRKLRIDEGFRTLWRTQ